MDDLINLIVILGPTASGKTSVAANLAYKLNTEIISADSRQVYTELTIGSGKDYLEYIVNGTKISYHLIDIASAGTAYNVFEFQHDFEKAFIDIRSKNMLPILCGGSGLYLDAVIQGYKLIQVPINDLLRVDLETKNLDELCNILAKYRKLHATTDTENKKRTIRAIEIEIYCAEHPDFDFSFPKISPLIFGINYDREMRRNRITERLKQRLENGLVDEVRSLLNEGITSEQLIYYGLEYKFLTQYIIGELSYNEMFIQLNIAIHQFAKRQMTWFRRMESKGIDIHWIEGQLPLMDKIDVILEKLKLSGVFPAQL